MDYISQFTAFVKGTAWKNKAALPNLSIEEIETECWTALALAIYRWDGSMGKLSTWIYTAVTGRMKDLRKRPDIQHYMNQEYSECPVMEEDSEDMILEEIDQATCINDRCCVQKILMEISQRN